MAKDYRSDPAGVAKYFCLIIKQHNLDWDDIQLLLVYVTETEQDLISKAAQALAEDCANSKTVSFAEIKNYFPHQNPEWDPNRSSHQDHLRLYQGWVAKVMEQAIPKTINWTALYAVRQGPSESPSEFLDRIREAVCQSTPLDPEDEIGRQQLISLFLGQSTGDIRCKLQKLQAADGRNLEIL